MPLAIMPVTTVTLRIRRLYRYAVHWLAALVMIAVVLPFFHRVDHHEFGLLVGIALPVLALHLAVNLRTLLEAVDTFRLAPGDSRSVLIDHWRAVVRQQWRWHVLAGVVKVGLALALMQYFTAASTRYEISCDTPEHLLHVLCFRSSFEFNSLLTHLPRIRRLLLVIPMLAGGGLVEAALAAGVGTALAGLAVRQGRQTGKTFSVNFGQRLTAILLRSLLAGLAVVTLLALDATIYRMQYAMFGDYIQNLNSRDTAVLLQIILTAVATLADGGTLAAANLMRPIEPSGFWLLLQLVSMLLGAMLTAALLVIGLRVVQTHLERQGIAVAPPARRFRSRLRAWTPGWLVAAFRRGYPPDRRALINLYAVGLLTLLIPVFVYIDYTRHAWLALVAASAFLSVGSVNFHALHMVRDTVNSDKNPDQLDLLRLTPITPAQRVVSAWAGLTRQAGVYFLSTVPVRLALALSVTQYLNSTLVDPGGVGRPFNYITYNYGMTYPPAYPQPYQFGLAVGALAALALIEAGMVCAAGLGGITLARRAGRMSVYLVRLVPLVSGAGIFLLLSDLNLRIADGSILSAVRRNREFKQYETIYWLRLVEQVQVTSISVVDGGIMAGANLLRPMSYVRVYYVLDTLTSYLLAGMIMGGLTALALWLTVRFTED